MGLSRIGSTIAFACVLAAVAVAGPLNDLKLFGYNPTANPKAVVYSADKQARFIVLTDHVIRAEYSATKSFEDRATLAIVNRDLPVPVFQVTNANGITTITIASSKVSMSYKNDAATTSFTADNLWGTSANGAAWHYGAADSGNLLGTVKSLDGLCTVDLNCNANKNIRIHDESLHCAWGLVSRGGWTVVDDSQNYILSGEPNGWFSNTDKAVAMNDLYFFAHGLNFKQALKDFSLIAGKQQVLSRPLLGSWYTRWYDFDQTDLTRLVGLYEKTNLPLDVLVLDMNWHTKNDWSGYTWDRQVFPYPQDVLDYAKKNGLMIAGNIHDADGIGSWEDKYQQMCSAVGTVPGETPVPFQPMNRTYMHALEDIVLTHAGFDFYWIDWQQGGAVYGCAGERMNPTFITDHVRGTDGLRTGTNKRSNVLARFGGLGSHRYPVGFSGDVLALTWECFRYQPYFSATAANVLYGSISHDLVGPENDHELHVRWMQFGAFSGVLRIHDRGMSAGSCWTSGSCPIVNMWRLPIEYLTPIRAAMTERLALLPYLYSETQRGFTSGVSMLRGLYIDFPSENDAYRMTGSGNSQYMFGDLMTVAPVVQQADSTTGLVSQSVWCPPGQWFDEVYGELVTGPQMLQRQFTIDDVPRLVKAGAIMPRLPLSEATKIGAASRAYPAIDLMIYPGMDSGSYTMIEDDGATYNYTLPGGVATTTVSYLKTGSSTIKVTVGGTTGAFAQKLPATRRVRVVFASGLPVHGAAVEVSGKTTEIQYARFSGDAMTWTYEAESANVVIDLGEVPTTNGGVMTVSFNGGLGAGSKLLTKRARFFAARSALAKRTLDNTRQTPDSTTLGSGFFKKTAATAGALSHLAKTSMPEFFSTMGNYTSIIQRGLDEIEGKSVELLQLYNADRKDSCLCGTIRCHETNFNYKALWVEGYQPAVAGPNTATLNDYWSQAATDNWATTATSSPNPNYTPAVFQNGIVLKTQEPGTVCLKVWYSTAKQDHMTTASARGETYAKDMGYSVVEACTGYVYESLAAFRVGKAKQLKQMKQAEQLVGKIGGVANVHGVATEKASSMARLGQDAAFQRAIALLESTLH